MKFTRRTLLKTAGGALGAAILGTGGYYATRDRVSIGIIGAGIRGNELARILRLASWIYWRYGKVVAVCDADSDRSRKLIAEQAPSAIALDDYRRLLEIKEIEAVIIATPDHWHIPMARDALSAGKAIYLEKPVSHSIHQGYELLNQIDKNTRPILVGTSQRSDTRFRQVAELVRHGRIGQVQRAEITIPIKPETLAEKPGEAAPSSLNWKQWLGSAPDCPFSLSRFKDWRSYWVYGGGEATNFGTHHLDMILWALGLEHTEPKQVSSKVRSTQNAAHLAPREWEANLVYPSGLTVSMKTQAEPKEGSIRFFGSQSELYADRLKVEGPAWQDMPNQPLEGPKLHSSSTMHPRNTLQHLLHFLDVVRGKSSPVSDYASACHVAVACHLVNLSLRTDAVLKWDGQSHKFIDAPEPAHRLL